MPRLERLARLMAYRTSAEAADNLIRQVQAKIAARVRMTAERDELVTDVQGLRERISEAASRAHADEDPAARTALEKLMEQRQRMRQRIIDIQREIDGYGDLEAQLAIAFDAKAAHVLATGGTNGEELARIEAKLREHGDTIGRLREARAACDRLTTAFRDLDRDRRAGDNSRGGRLPPAVDAELTAFVVKLRLLDLPLEVGSWVDRDVEAPTEALDQLTTLRRTFAWRESEHALVVADLMRERTRLLEPIDFD